MAGRSSWSRSTTRPGVTAELAAESPNAAPVYRQSTNRAEPKKSIRPAEIIQRWADVIMFNDRPLKRSLSGLEPRVPDRADLQPRRRQARGEDQLQRRPGDSGPGVPQRRRHPFHLRAGGDGRARRPRRGRPADDGVVHLPRPDGTRLSLAQPPARARLLLPPPGLSPERRVGRCCRRARIRSSSRRGPEYLVQIEDDHGARDQDASRVVPAQALDPTWPS